MALVVGVLRGAKSAKVMERRFDRVATHGTRHRPLFVTPVSEFLNNMELNN
jgi:hypothetical protein